MEAVIWQAICAIYLLKTVHVPGRFFPLPNRCSGMSAALGENHPGH